jgi:DNA-binding response OmpR family regulator
MPVNVPVILLVEDHRDSREMYAQMFRLAGFRVLEAEGGDAALAETAGVCPSLVVTDLRMPGCVSAPQLCRHFSDRGVPVLALTGVIPGREHSDMRAAGCLEILLKPVRPDELIVEVRRILSGPQDRSVA